MYKELKKIKVANNFNFTINDSLEEVCNAPETSGIFLVYDVNEEVKELIMVASTGTIQNDGTLKSKNGGLFDKIVNGHQFAKTGRKYSWPAQMKLENIDRLEVYWYESFNDKIKLIPTTLEGQILQSFLDENGKLPRWNVAF
jgi:predicted Rdx family selenoprotein